MGVKGFLTVDEAAAILGVQPQSVRKMRTRGVLKGVAVSARVYLFTAAEIEMAKSRRGPGKPPKDAPEKIREKLRQSE